MSRAEQLAVEWTERGWVPDALVRKGIRRLLKDRLVEIDAADCESMSESARDFVAAMDRSPIAPLPHKANDQHYEVAAEFFEMVLGHRRKYSCCYWPDGVHTLDDAEDAALRSTCQRAEPNDGMRILELGCGWGSLTLWMAERYPASRITAVSNSASQRRFIERQAEHLRLDNLEVITADMNDFHSGERYDRVVSVEMFEHMRNYRTLFERVHDWLRPGGSFFLHIFCHRATPYAFVEHGPSDWMSRYFFSGGIMPSEDLPLRFQEHLKLRDLWRWNGTHYARTARAWLHNMSSRKTDVLQTLQETYGEEDVNLWWTRWRLFFMACEELFGYEGGQQWWVSHYLFDRPTA